MCRHLAAAIQESHHNIRYMAAAIHFCQDPMFQPGKIGATEK